MKLISLLFILLTLTLNAIAIDVIINPYNAIDYDSINAYPQNECSCNCNDFQENETSRFNKHWWE